MSRNFIVRPQFATQPLTLQGKAAIKQYLQGLSGTLSTTDLLTLTTLRDAVMIHTEEGRFSDARAICGQLLAACERLLGGKHDFTLSILTTLGDMYCRQGDTKKGLHIYRRALAGLEDVHGPEHPVPLVVAAIVATVYTVVVDANARGFVETALGRMERVFGEHHPLTTGTAINLALVLLRQGGPGQGVEVFERAMEDGLESGEEVVGRPKEWNCGGLLFALGMLLGMIYCFPKCTVVVVVGVLLGGYFLPRGVIVGGILLGLYFFSRREFMA